MTYTLQHLLHIYKPILKHTDEQIILLFHFCMLDNRYLVANGTNDYLFIYAHNRNDPLRISYTRNNISFETKHYFVGNEYHVKYICNENETKSKFDTNECIVEGTLQNEEKMMIKMNTSIRNASRIMRSETTEISSDSRQDVFFDISINNQLVGQIKFKLFDDVVPITAANFRALCTDEYSFGYEGSRFHRVEPQYLVAGGDITNHDGTGGKSIYDGMFADENFIQQHSKQGLLSMANRGPNSGVVFGEVVDGMNVVKIIESYGSPSGIPTAEILTAKSGIVR